MLETRAKALSLEPLACILYYFCSGPISVDPIRPHPRHAAAYRDAAGDGDEEEDEAWPPEYEREVIRGSRAAH